jgi:hypothetical protein
MSGDRPAWPPTGWVPHDSEARDEWQPTWFVAGVWGTLAIAVVWLLYSHLGGAIGECEYRGDVPGTGLAVPVSVVLGLIGLVEAVVAFGRIEPREAARRLGLAGIAVLVLSFGSAIGIGVRAANACEAPSDPVSVETSS